MRYSDEGIVVDIQPSSEKRFLIKIFSKDNGNIRAVTPKKVDLGQRIFFDYSAKHPEQLGFVKIQQNIVLLFSFSLSPFVASACRLLSQFLPEQHPYPELYEHTLNLLSDHLAQSKGYYIWFEEVLLQHLGFALSLEHCAVTKTKDNLIYVSPKTGRAICQSVGAPYHNMLILLPQFMSERQYQHIDESDFVLGLKVTGYFIQKHLGQLPQVRNIL